MLRRLRRGREEIPQQLTRLRGKAGELKVSPVIEYLASILSNGVPRRYSPRWID
jgi:hypothetical protein